MTFLQKSRFIFEKTVNLLITIIILSACTEDKPTEPEKEKNNIITATIGVNGGELKTEGFSLFVPAGSFRNETTLSVSISDDLDYLGESSVSETYIIQDFPTDFENSIKIAIKYNGVLSDSSYIVMTTTTEKSFLVDSVYLYDFLSITDSSGFLVAEFDNTILSNLLNKCRKISTESRIEKITISGEAITGMVSYQSDYFFIEYPRAIGNDGRIFTEHMDDIFEIFLKDFSFDFKYNNSFDVFNLVNYNLKTPFRIFVFDNNKTGIIFQESPSNNRFAFLNFFVGGVQTLPSAKDQTSLFMAVIWHAVLLETYNKNQEESKVRLSSALLWWFEDYLGISSNNKPPVTLEGNELSLFGGFVYQTISPGLSSLIKYIVDFKNYDMSNFGQIFEEAHNNDKNHYVSLLSHVNSLIMDWFPDYYEKYIKGEIYNIDGTVFLNQPGDWLQTWNVDEVTDTLKTFTKTYNDLSAKRFFIELNHEYEDESASLVLETSTGANSDGTAILVFGVDANDNLEHLVTARAEPAEIPNLKAYYQNGTKKFLVVVVNCINNGVDYTGNHEITFEVKIEKEKASIEIADGNYNCYVSRRGITFDLHEEISGTDGSYEKRDYSETFSSSGTVSGVISGGIFTGVHDDDTTVVTFSSDFKEINYSLASHYWSGFNNVNSTLRINAVNIPLYSNTPSYQVKGPDLINYISYAEYTRTESWMEGEIRYTKEVTTTKIRYDNSSSIFIIMNKL